MDSRVWDGQFEWFRAQADVIRFDLPGGGRSEPPSANGFSGVDDLGLVLDLLAIEQASIIGLSGGARIAIHFALGNPFRVEKIVAAAPGLSGYEGWSLPADRLAAGRAGVRRGDREQAVREWLAIWAPVTGVTLLGLARTNAESLFTDTQLIDLDPPAIDRLRELEAPILVIVGDEDQSDILAIADIIAGSAPNVATERIRGADHCPNVFSPDLFNRMVAEFLCAGRDATAATRGR